MGNGRRRSSSPRSVTDHPRTRGERLCKDSRRPPQNRIIPARVGNGSTAASRLRRIADHPRTRGERWLSVSWFWGWRGSSPHAWGTGHLVVSSPAPYADHPRTRGERTAGISSGRQSGGSSPHAWGPVSPGVGHGPPERIIPARVGNGADLEDGVVPVLDHPRTRVERGRQQRCDALQRGSSPHAWGTAYPPEPPSAAQPDHPRTRGERISSSDPLRILVGSSPHAWGTGRSIHPDRTGLRIIPARVGNGLAMIATLVSRSDHPRTRGERCWNCTRQLGDCGSSPHAWGTGQGWGAQQRVGRIIPARVGNGG